MVVVDRTIDGVGVYGVAESRRVVVALLLCVFDMLHLWVLMLSSLLLLSLPLLFVLHVLLALVCSMLSSFP